MQDAKKFTSLLNTEIDGKIQILIEQIKKKPEVIFTYFIQDSIKEGGAYISVTGIVKKIDTYNQKSLLT